MGWKTQFSQVKDEIEDIADARTDIRRRHSKKQLQKRVRRLKRYLNELKGDELTAATLFVGIGQEVLDGTISASTGKRYVNHPDEYIAVLEQRELERIARESPAARQIRAATSQLRKLLSDYAKSGTTKTQRDQLVREMEQKLNWSVVSVALHAEQPVPGVDDREWRGFKSTAQGAQRRVAEWTAAREREAAREALRERGPMTVQAVRLTAFRVQPLAINAGALSMKIQAFRGDPVGKRAELESSLAQVQRNLEANPTGEGADRLREVISQAEAMLSPESTPVEVAPQIQETAPTLPPTQGRNWLLIGGAVLGLAGAATATFFVVKKVRAKKKKGE